MRFANYCQREVLHFDANGVIDDVEKNVRRRGTYIVKRVPRW